MTLKDTLIKQAQELGIETDKLTIAQLKEAINKNTAKLGSAPSAETNEEDSSAIKDEKEEKEGVFAKAGKRSQKNIEEAEAEAKRQVRKKEAPEVTPVKKIIPPTRPRIERRGKKYKQVAKGLDLKKVYEPLEALDLITKTSVTKFDSSVDLVVSLGVNIKQADQNIRDFVILPAGLGKNLKVAVFADDKEAQLALEAGADIAGKEVFLQQLDKNIIDFDILIAAPQLMIDLSKYAKLLGPKGLMPNPKSGTVTKDVVKVVKEAKAGRVEYRVDENGLIHLSIGKVSFGKDKLQDNFEAVLKSIKNNKPASLKGVYIKSIHLSTTMGPSLQMNIPV